MKEVQLRRDAHYYFSDFLGTHSLITDQNGTMPPQEESDFYPYGGEIPITTGDTNHYKFNGKERDTESGLDNFGARFDSSSIGRFMTPDWSAGEDPVPYAQLLSPQTLNLYSYAMNNPVSRTDPTGHVSMSPVTAGSFHCGLGNHCVGDAPLIGNSCNDAGGTCLNGDQSHDELELLAEQNTGRLGQGSGSDQNEAAQNTTPTETQTEPKQLSAGDVSKGIESAKAGTGSNAKKIVDFLNSFGANWNLSGDALRQGLKDSKVNAHGEDKKVDSISRTGDKITVRLNKSINLGLFKTKTTITFDVGTKSGRPALVNIQGVEVFHGYHYVPKNDYGPD